jgi:outer membrane protein assembly factor BamB
MLSYGKVESVWPVIGGVLVHDGKAYASAGRTQGSDGGLLVRAFTPETGKPLWAKAIPQSGHGVSQPKPKRNDAMARHGDLALLMGHHIDLKTGELTKDPVLEFKAKALQEEQKKLGRKMNRKDQNALWKKLAPELAKLGSKKFTVGLEGMYSWNWTRVGHRKFMELNYGGLKGDTVSWTEDRIAACDRNNRLNLTFLGEPDGTPAKKKGNRAFTIPPDRQVTSLVVCKNAVVLGGAIVDKEEAKGFVQAVSLEDGAPVWDKTFKAKLSFNGLAVEGGQVIATFSDGTVVLLK